MEIKKGLTFSTASKNIMERPIAFFGTLVGGVLVIILLIVLAESRVMSERAASLASKGMFIGMVGVAWRILKGDFRKP